MDLFPYQKKKKKKKEIQDSFIWKPVNNFYFRGVNKCVIPNKRKRKCNNRKSQKSWV